ncbi:MAG: NADH-quinone oxidoreductase subunit K [Actinomycetota bacterium]
MSIALLAAVGGLTGVGLYLITARSLSRIILGFSLLGHAAVLALLTAGGRPGAAPIADSEAWSNAAVEQTGANPLPQALALTAIVISFGLTLFLLALAGRQQALTGDDLVEDDLEDQRVATGTESDGEGPDPEDEHGANGAHAPEADTAAGAADAGPEDEHGAHAPEADADPVAPGSEHGAPGAVSAAIDDAR